jgi:hypothetical protein
MAKNVTGLFDVLEKARGAVSDLEENGFEKESIELIPNDMGEGLLVVVMTDDQTADRASAIINRHHPVDMGRKGQSWQGFNETARESIFVDSQPSYREREPRSELDFGTGAQPYLAGKAIEDYDRAQLDADLADHPIGESWKVHEERFRSHFDAYYALSGKEWGLFREAYQFGFETAKDPTYASTSWERGRQYIQQRWNMRMMGRDWDEYAGAVQEGWEAGLGTEE